VKERNVAPYNTDEEFAFILVSMKDLFHTHQYSLWSAAFPVLYKKTVEEMARQYNPTTIIRN
jgi:hypothetical protein